MTRPSSFGIFLCFSVALFALPLFAAAQQFVPLTSIPGVMEAATTRDLSVLFNTLYKICIGVCAVLAVLQIMRGGLVYMMGDSVTEKRDARRHILMAIVGLLLVLSPAIVFGVIDSRILDLNVDVRQLQPSARQAPASTTPAGPGVQIDQSRVGGWLANCGGSRDMSASQAQCVGDSGTIIREGEACGETTSSEEQYGTCVAPQRQALSQKLRQCLGVSQQIADCAAETALPNRGFSGDKVVGTGNVNANAYFLAVLDTSSGQCANHGYWDYATQRECEQGRTWSLAANPTWSVIAGSCQRVTASTDTANVKVENRLYFRVYAPANACRDGTLQIPTEAPAQMQDATRPGGIGREGSGQYYHNTPWPADTWGFVFGRVNNDGTPNACSEIAYGTGFANEGACTTFLNAVKSQYAGWETQGFCLPNAMDDRGFLATRSTVPFCGPGVPLRVNL